MHYILDTSYVVVLFDIPGMANAAAKAQIVTRLEWAVTSGGILYMPVPVIFETCNHIAQIPNGFLRISVATAFAGAVKQSLENGSPWTITPTHGGDVLESWVSVLSAAIGRFNTEFAANQVGLTDVAIIMESERLVAALGHYPQPRPKVHIHTNDQALKAREPDAELAPILW